TRGRSWGFRFLLDAGLRDPLEIYERAFAEDMDTPSTCIRGSGTVAVRFGDPMGRRDAAGRLCPHEFIGFADVLDEIETVQDGIDHFWPLVAPAYARIWAAQVPPSAADFPFCSYDGLG